MLETMAYGAPTRQKQTILTANRCLRLSGHSSNVARCGPQQKRAVKGSDGCLLDIDTRAGENIVSDWTFCDNLQLSGAKQRGTLESRHMARNPRNPKSLHDGRVDMDPKPMAAARTLGRPPRIPRNEELGRRIYITKRMVSEFGWSQAATATWCGAWQCATISRDQRTRRR